MNHTDGIDISHWQGNVDFSKVAGAGIRNLFMKCSQQTYEDPNFERYCQQAACHIPHLGCYIYNVASSVEEAKTEANFAVKCLKGKQMNLGVWLDIEDKILKTVSKDQLTEIIHTEAEILKKAGYKVGIYCSYDWYLHVLDTLQLTSFYPFWIARYSLDGTYKESLSPKDLPGVKLWQYSCKQQVDGIRTAVDADCFFVPAAEWWDEEVGELQETGNAATASYSHTQFVKEVQQALGVTADGIAGPKTLAATVTLSRNKNNRHAAVKPVQRYLNALGFDCGKADGIAGQSFDKAVKAFQKAKGCVSDGEITAKGNTWKKLLEE